MPELRVAGVTNMHLFATKCRGCGELNVHGFWGELKKTVDIPRRRVVVEFDCDKCAVTRARVFRLTTAKTTRHRLVNDWIRVGFWLATRRWMPRRFVPSVVKAVMWLERNFPI